MGNSISGSVLDDLGSPTGMGERLIAKDGETELEARMRQDNTKKWPNEYESLDYDDNENEAFRRQHFHAPAPKLKANLREARELNRLKWIVHALIGVVVGLIAFFIDFFVRMISGAKYDDMENLLQDCTKNETKAAFGDSCFAGPYFILICFNCGFVLIATVLCGTFAVEAKGSGIPEIKCFLNGVKRRGWLNLKTGIVKVLGILFSVSATMPVGKEGPMIHSGAIVGAGLPQMKSTQFGFDFKLLTFRNDHYKRDFTAAGAAAGVSAAFGAPIGGVLFALEEGASHWNQDLTWKTLLTSVMALFTLRIFLSGTAHKETPHTMSGWGKVASNGLVDFGIFPVVSEQPLWTAADIPPFIFMGILGGLMGAAWCALQKRITVLRMKLKLSVRMQMVEAVVLCALNTTLFYCAALGLGKCQSLTIFYGNNTNATIYLETNGNWIKEESTRKFFCKANAYEFNDMATLCFNPLEDVIKHLLHFDGVFSYTALFVSFFLLFVTSCWTYGLLIPSGLFVPMLVTGAVYGRIVGEILHQHWTDHPTYPGTYALIGAAAFLGGVARMTISLAVILLEATSEITFAPPIVLVLLVAKWVGDQFDVGIYDIHIKLKKVPLLEWEAEEEMKRFQASDVMKTDLVTTYPVARVSDIVNMLQSCTHNGFPVVVEHAETPGPPRFLGIVLRSDLVTLLQNRVWGELRNDTTDQPTLSMDAFLRKYPNRTPISEVVLPPPDVLDNLWIDVAPYMNDSPYTLPPHAALNRCFRLFRTMGLRHIPIIDEDGGVVGVITRQELTEHTVHKLMHDFDGHSDEEHHGTLYG